MVLFVEDVECVAEFFLCPLLVPVDVRDRVEKLFDFPRVEGHEPFWVRSRFQRVGVPFVLRDDLGLLQPLVHGMQGVGLVALSVEIDHIVLVRVKIFVHVVDVYGVGCQLCALGFLAVVKDHHVDQTNELVVRQFLVLVLVRIGEALLYVFDEVPFDELNMVRGVDVHV